MPIDELIDRLVAQCGGDVHRALKALLLIKERLEAELLSFYELSTNLTPQLSLDRGTLH